MGITTITMVINIIQGICTTMDINGIENTIATTVAIITVITIIMIHTGVLIAVMAIQIVAQTRPTVLTEATILTMGMDIDEAGISQADFCC